MDFEGAKKYLDGFISFEKDKMPKYDASVLNLDKIKSFLIDLKIDYSSTKFVHLAGSKGKGTTSRLIADYLIKSEYKVGVFASPHVLTVRERISLSGENISKEEFSKLVFFIKENIADYNLTYFEVLTVMALKFFVDNNVDFAILEVGLGGRLDSTNIIDPVVSVITTIEKEHTEILGDTYEEIVYEKLGIVKPAKPVVIGYQNEEVKKIIQSSLKDKEDVYFTKELSFKLDNDNLAILKNAPAAFKVLNILLGDVDIKLFQEVVRSFFMIGKLDIRKLKGIDIVFDVAHTKNSFSNLIFCLKKLFPSKKFVFLISLMKGKDLASIATLLKDNADRVVCTNSNKERGIDASVLAENFDADILEDLNFGLDEIIKQIKKDQVLVVTGSHFLVSKVMLKL